MNSNLGKKFEQNFKSSAQKDDLLIIRFNDTDLSYNGNSFSKFTAKNPADFEIFETPYLFFLELKHTSYKAIGIQRDLNEPDKMIKAHQINSLTQMSLHEKCVCGLVLSFLSEETGEEDTWFLNIKDFNKFLTNSDKKSINKTDIVIYNGIKIESTKKRVYFQYNVKKMIEDIIKREEASEHVCV